MDLGTLLLLDQPQLDFFPQLLQPDQHPKRSRLVGLYYNQNIFLKFLSFKCSHNFRGDFRGFPCTDIGGYAFSQWAEGVCKTRKTCLFILLIVCIVDKYDLLPRSDFQKYLGPGLTLA